MTPLAGAHREARLEIERRASYIPMVMQAQFVEESPRLPRALSRNAIGFRWRVIATSRWITPLVGVAILALAGCGGSTDPLQAREKAADALTHGRFPEAEEMLHRAIENREREMEEPDSVAAMLLIDLGTVLEAQDKWLEAETCYKRVLETGEKLWGAGSPHLADAHAGRGRTNYALNLYHRADAAFRLALRLRQSDPSADSAKSARDLKHLGDVLIAQRRYAAADSVYRRAMELCVARANDCDSLRAGLLQGAGEALTETGRAADAQSMLKRAMDLTMGARPTLHARAQSTLGRCLARQQRRSEAESLMVRAHSHMLDRLGENDPWSRKSASWLADLYTDWNKPDLASHYAAQARRR